MNNAIESHPDVRVISHWVEIEFRHAEAQERLEAYSRHADAIEGVRAASAMGRLQQRDLKRALRRNT